MCVTSDLLCEENWQPMRKKLNGKWKARQGGNGVAAAEEKK
jgi:hypothetical protein